MNQSPNNHSMDPILRCGLMAVGRTIFVGLLTNASAEQAKEILLEQFQYSLEANSDSRAEHVRPA